MSRLRLLLLLAGLASSVTACNYTDGACTAALVRDTLAAYSQSGVVVQDPGAFSSALATAVAGFGSRCLGITQSVLRAARMLVPAGNEQLMNSIGQAFTTSTGYRVDYTFMELQRIAEEVAFQLQTNVSLYDAWILDVISSEVALRSNAVAGLEGVAEERGDDDVHPYFHEFAATYQNRSTAVVLSGMVPLLYWRKDILARFNITAAPATWDEMLMVVRMLNGSDFNGDGIPDAPLCWGVPSYGCTDSGLTLISILAPMLQTQGRPSGWILDPASGSLLASGPPLRRALRLLRSLSRYGTRNPCGVVNPAMFNGTCAMTVHWPPHFKVGEVLFPHLHGKMGAAPLPGSSVVWDREAQAWLSCDGDPSACPHATSEAPLFPPPSAADPSAAAVAAAAGGGAFAGAPPPPATAAGGSSNSSSSGGGGAATNGSSLAGAGAPPGAAVQGVRRVNRAPYTGMTALVGSVDVRTPAEYRDVGFNLFLQINSINASWEQLLRPATAIGPFRIQHLDPANEGRWVAGGFDRGDVRVWLESWRYTIEHPNLALPLRLPGSRGVRDAFQWAADQAVQISADQIQAAAADDGGGWDVDTVVVGIANRIRTALDSAGPWSEVLRSYRSSIGYVPPAAPPPGPPDGGGGGGGSGGGGVSSRTIAIAASLSAAAACALLVAGTYWGVVWRRRRRSHRTLFGRALAPGASAATSLVVTDIVDSTRLWESVPTLAMAKAVQLHHDTLRSLLKEHNGYESATEGDSFILSFYAAADAVAFAVRAQAALLALPWPEEVLDEELCRPQLAVCRTAPSAPERTGRGGLAAARGSLLLSPRSQVQTGVGVGAGAQGQALGSEASTALLQQSSALTPYGATNGHSNRQASGTTSGDAGGGNSRVLAGAASAAGASGGATSPVGPWGGGGGGVGGLGSGVGGGLSDMWTAGSTGAYDTTLPSVPGGTTGGSRTSPSQLLTLLQPPPSQPPRQFSSGPAKWLALPAVLNFATRKSKRNVGAGGGGVAGLEGSGSAGTAGSGGGGAPTGTASWGLTVGSSGGHAMAAGPLGPGRPSPSMPQMPYTHASGSPSPLPSPPPSIPAGAPVAAAAAAVAAAVLASPQRAALAALASSPPRSPRAFSSPQYAPSLMQQQQQPRAESPSRPPSRMSGTYNRDGPPPLAAAAPPLGAAAAEARFSEGSADSYGQIPSNRTTNDGGGGGGGGTVGGGADGSRQGGDRSPLRSPRGRSGLASPQARFFASLAGRPRPQSSASGGDSSAGGGGGGSGPPLRVVSVAAAAATTASDAGGGGGGPARRETAPNLELTQEALQRSLQQQAPPPRAQSTAGGGDGGGGTGSPRPRPAGLSTDGSSSAAASAAAAAAELTSTYAHLCQMPSGLLSPAGGAVGGGGGGGAARDLNAELLDSAAGGGAPAVPSNCNRGGGAAGALIAAHMNAGGGLEFATFGSGSEAQLLNASGAFGSGAILNSGPRTSATLAALGGFGGSRRQSIPATAGLTAALLGLAGTAGYDSTTTAQLGTLVAPAPVRSLPLAAFYASLFRPCLPWEEPGPATTPVFAGLQVRIGVHSGVSTTQVSYNRVAGRTQYSGAALEAAKSVCDAAQGGMVLLSASAFDQISSGAGGGGGGTAAAREAPHVVLHMGRHVLGKQAARAAEPLYLAQGRELLARIAFLPPRPVRSVAQTEPGVLEAPLGAVAVSALQVVGLPTLMAWDKAATEEALDTWQRVAGVALRRMGGHVLEEAQGRMIAVFGQPYDAIRWTAAVEALLKEADWSEGLLGHELAEEVQGPVLMEASGSGPSPDQLSRLLFRGLRVKGATDWSPRPVKAELLPATGRLAYRGSLAANVQRVTAYVSTGQVVCTDRAWRAYELVSAAVAAGSGGGDTGPLIGGGGDPASSRIDGGVASHGDVTLTTGLIAAAAAAAAAAAMASGGGDSRGGGAYGRIASSGDVTSGAAGMVLAGNGTNTGGGNTGGANASGGSGAWVVMGASLGSHSIRGVGDRVELWSVRLASAHTHVPDDLSFFAMSRPRSKPAPAEDAAAPPLAAAAANAGGGGGGAAAAQAAAAAAKREEERLAKRLAALPPMPPPGQAGLPVWEPSYEELRAMLAD